MEAKGGGGRGEGAADGILDRLLDAVAALRRYPYPERAPAWRARLAMNGPELARFAALGDPGCDPMLRPAPARDAAPGLPERAPILSFADAVRGGRIDARAHAAAALARAREAADLNAFTTLNDDAPAEAADRRDGALAGVLVAVKDLMAVRGLPLTGGTGRRDPDVPERDATAVARLRAAGAVVIGAANLHELAYGVTSRNPHFGAVRNPCDPRRSAGGSSGGSAAAVAAGIVPVAVGTDTAGSIRIPAACCGVVGIKPSYDLVPRDGVLPLAWSLDHVGPIAGNVADAAAALAVMAGGPGRGPLRSAEAGRIRLVRPRNFFFEILEPSLRLALETALARLEEAGISLIERPIEGVEDAAAIQFQTICAEAAEAHWPRLLDAPEALGEDVRVRLEIGQFLLAKDYVRAQRLRRALAAAMAAALEGVDALVTPTLIVGAPPVGADEVEVDGQRLPVHTAMTRCTAPFNLTGLPALTLPCGRDRDGLPVGLQLVGRPGGDCALIEVALAVEAALGQSGKG